MPADDRGTSVDHRRAISEHRVRSDGIDVLLDRKRLPREGGFVDVQTGGRHDACVRDDALALAEREEISDDDVLGRDRHHAAAPDDPSGAAKALAQRQHGPLRSCLLREAERAVQDDNRRDRRGFQRLADRRRDHGGRDEQQHERVAELPQRELHVWRPLRAREQVRAEASQAGGGLVGVEPAPAIAAELAFDDGSLCGVRGGCAHAVGASTAASHDLTRTAALRPGRSARRGRPAPGSWQERPGRRP